MGAYLVFLSLQFRVSGSVEGRESPIPEPARPLRHMSNAIDNRMGILKGPAVSAANVVPLCPLVWYRSVCGVYFTFSVSEQRERER